MKTRWIAWLWFCVFLALFVLIYSLPHLLDFNGSYFIVIGGLLFALAFGLNLVYLKQDTEAEAAELGFIGPRYQSSLITVHVDENGRFEILPKYPLPTQFPTLVAGSIGLMLGMILFQEGLVKNGHLDWFKDLSAPPKVEEWLAFAAVSVIPAENFIDFMDWKSSIQPRHWLPLFAAQGSVWVLNIMILAKLRTLIGRWLTVRRAIKACAEITRSLQNGEGNSLDTATMTATLERLRETLTRFGPHSAGVLGDQIELFLRKQKRGNDVATMYPIVAMAARVIGDLGSMAGSERRTIERLLGVANLPADVRINACYAIWKLQSKSGRNANRILEAFANANEPMAQEFLLNAIDVMESWTDEVANFLREAGRYGNTDVIRALAQEMLTSRGIDVES